MRTGSAAHSLHRQHTGPSRIKRTITRSSGRDELSARVPRVHHQYGKISDDPQSCHRVSRPHSELNHYGARPPTSEDKTNLSGGSETNETEEHLSSPPGTTVGENECNGMCNPPTPLFYRHLQMALSNTLERSNQNYEALMTLTWQSGALWSFSYKQHH